MPARRLLKLKEDGNGAAEVAQLGNGRDRLEARVVQSAVAGIAVERLWCFLLLKISYYYPPRYRVLGNAGCELDRLESADAAAIRIRCGLPRDEKRSAGNVDVFFFFQHKKRS